MGAWTSTSVSSSDVSLSTSTLTRLLWYAAVAFAADTTAAAAMVWCVSALVTVRISRASAWPLPPSNEAFEACGDVSGGIGRELPFACDACCCCSRSFLWRRSFSAASSLQRCSSHSSLDGRHWRMHATKGELVPFGIILAPAVGEGGQQ